MKVAVIGYEIEGRSAAEYWRRLGDEVTVCDQDPDKSIPEGLPSRVGPAYLKNLDNFDLIVRSSGVNPKTILAENPAVNDKITTVINEFLRVCPTKNIIGITGTKGKGTTSTLTAKMLEAAGHKTFLGGNIGTSPLDFLPQLSAKSWVVLELSSYQLEDIRYSPALAVCLMVEPDHLNWHGTLDTYTAAKANLFRHQKPQDTAIYFANNQTSHAIASTSPGKKIPYFARPGAYVADNAIVIDGTEICKTDELQLLGQHNWQNACAAATILWQVTHSVAPIRNVLTTFSGLPHRLEFVRELDGVRYYNDSFASVPSASQAAIEAVSGPKVLILGGYDRQLPLEPLVKTIKKHQGDLRTILLIGQSTTRLAAALKAVGVTGFRLSPARTMTEIIQEARGQAKNGDSVVLSPGFPSFDMFKNFEDRGLQFNREVHKLR